MSEEQSRHASTWRRRAALQTWNSNSESNSNGNGNSSSNGNSNSNNISNSNTRKVIVIIVITIIVRESAHVLGHGTTTRLRSTSSLLPTS